MKLLSTVTPVCTLPLSKGKGRNLQWSPGRGGEANLWLVLLNHLVDENWACSEVILIALHIFIIIVAAWSASSRICKKSVLSNNTIYLVCFRVKEIPQLRPWSYNVLHMEATYTSLWSLIVWTGTLSRCKGACGKSNVQISSLAWSWSYRKGNNNLWFAHYSPIYGI